MKTLMILLILALFSADTQGNSGYYEVHPEHKDVAIRELQTAGINHPELINFLQATREISSGPFSFTKDECQEILNKVYPEQSFDLLLEQANFQMNFDDLSQEIKIAIIKNYIMETNPNKITDLENAIEEMNQEILKAQRLYLESYQILGKGNTPAIRYAINKYILGMYEKSDQIDQSEQAFQILKATNFISTSIQTTQGYTYSSKTSITQFLHNHPNIHTIVLGCGNCISTVITNKARARHDLDYEPKSSSLCQETHHHSTDEVTVSLDLRGYSARGSIADIIADGRSDEFWEGVAEGLNGRKLDQIKDHSYYPISTLSLHHITNFLKPGGILSITLPEPDAQRAREMVLDQEYFTLIEDDFWLSPLTNEPIKHPNPNSGIKLLKFQYVPKN